MKILIVNHNSIQYEFRLLERSRVVQISKDNQLTYEMTWSVNHFVCSCPGFRFRHKCWHTEMIGLLKQQKSITEPWAQWAEDAQEMMEERG